MAVVLSLSMSAAAANPSQDVARARGEFNQGNYKDVIGLLVPQLYPKPRISDDELKEARYLLAEAYFFSNQQDKAEEQFVALLFIDPTFTLDPVLEDPKVYGFFEAIRSERKDQLEELERLRREAAAAAARPKTQIIIDREHHDTSILPNLIPLGYGQFRNGQRRWGYVFLISEGVLFGTSLGLFLAQAIQYGFPTSMYPPEDRSALLTRQVIQVGTGGVGLLIYGIGVLHAIYNMKPAIVETRREVPIEKPKTTFVVPYLTPDTVGVGVTWEF